MWKAFRFLVIILVLAASGAWAADNPGNFIVTWMGYRIETSFTLVATVLVLVMALLFWLYRVTVRTIGGPAALLGYYGNRRKTRGQEALRQGLVAVAAGNPAEVRKLAARANALLNDPPMTLLLSAQAAQLEGDDKRATKAFKEMLGNPETEFLGLRGLFLQAARGGYRLEALGHAERAFELQPETPWVFNALFELQTAIGEWSSAALTLEKSVASKHIEAGVAKRRRAVLYTEQALASTDEAEAQAWGQKAADLSPGLVPAAVLAARHHIAEGNLWNAAQAIEKTWTVLPHPDLVPAYVEARKGRDPDVEDIKADAKWLKGLADFNASHIESRLLRAQQDLVLGRLKRARKGLKGLSEGYATARVCKLMADIESADANEEEARNWLAKTVTAPRDAHWMCETCGRECAKWTSTCYNCNAFDTLSWAAPADLVADLVLEPVEAEADERAEMPDVSKTVAPPATPPATPPAAAPVIIDLEVEEVVLTDDPVAVPAEAPKPSVNPDKESITVKVSPVGATNPLARESAAPDTNGETPLRGPAVDDPGPGSDDPFSEEDDRW
jgi:HemY protein